MKLLKPDSPARPAHLQRLENKLRPLDYIILTVGAAQWPLGVMAKNHWQVVHPERILVVIVAVSLIASLIAYLWVRLGGDRQTAVLTVFIATVFLMRGGALLWRYGNLVGWSIICAAVAISGYAGNRLKREPILAIVTAILVVMLGSSPIIGVVRHLGMGSDQIVRIDHEAVELTVKPDLFLVILDGYPGPISLQHEFGVSNPELAATLQGLGFQLPTSAWSPYWSTERAVPAILDASYPAPSAELSPATIRGLHAMVAGDNQTLDIFADNGYETTMVEAGWVGSSCGSQFDYCVPSPWLDELGFAVALETALSRQVVTRYGSAYSLDSLSTMRALEEQAGIQDGNRPRFVFAHVLAPHSPYLLDESCQIEGSIDRVRASEFGYGHAEAAVSNFLSHASCVDRFIVDFAELVEEDDVVVFVGDHGTDRRRQLLDGAESDPAAVLERMNVFVAARVGPSCEIGDELVTSNLMRRVLSCYSASPIPEVEERVFLPGYELSTAEVRRLVEEATFVNAAGSIAQGS